MVMDGEGFYCEQCEAEGVDRAGCVVGAFMYGPDGVPVERIPFGQEAYESGTPARMPSEERCSDCGVVRGRAHHWRCLSEWCPNCNGEMILCSCRWKPGAS